MTIKNGVEFSKKFRNAMLNTTKNVSDSMCHTFINKGTVEQMFEDAEIYDAKGSKVLHIHYKGYCKYIDVLIYYLNYN